MESLLYTAFKPIVFLISPTVRIPAQFVLFSLLNSNEETGL